MTDIMGSMPAPEDGGVTIPIEGKRRRPQLAVGGFGALVQTERTAGIMVLAALLGVYLLRVLFRGALGD